MYSSTNSSLSAVNVLTVSSIPSGSLQSKAPARIVQRLPDSRRKGSSDFDDVGGLAPLVAFDHIELDAIAVCQAAVTLRLDGREMDEEILALLGLDEPEPFGGVEPLHRALPPAFAAATAAAAVHRSRGHRHAPRRSTRASHRGLMTLEAIATVHRPTGRRRERHRGLSPAFRTNRLEHLPRGSASRRRARPGRVSRSLRLPILPAIPAARRRVGQPVVAVELLLTDRE